MNMQCKSVTLDFLFQFSFYVQNKRYKTYLKTSNIIITLFDCFQAMVQCVSSSEPDIAESREHTWPVTRNEFSSDTETQSTYKIIMFTLYNKITAY